jgi:hypothetical protein
MTGSILAWLAAALLVTFVVVWQLAIKRVEVGERRGLISAIIWLAMLLAIAALAQGTGTLAGVLAGVTLFVGGAYTFLYLMAGQSKQAPAVTVGEPLPVFSARDENGDVFEVASLQGHPILLKLFRGHW